MKFPAKAKTIANQASRFGDVSRKHHWRRLWTSVFLVLLISGTRIGGAESTLDSWRQFVAENCYRCHGPETQEGGLDLSALPTDLKDSAVLERWVLVHDRVRDLEMPPAEETQPDSSERGKFLEKLVDDLNRASLHQQQTEGRSRARRLNRDEYQNTLRDLLSVQRDYRTLLPEDGKSLGFDKVSTALSLSAEHLEAYMSAAEAAISDAFLPAPRVDQRRIPQRFEDLERLQRIFSYQFKTLPDGLVFFSDQWDNITGFQARQPGRYRFRVRAWAFQSEVPIKARFRAGVDAEGSRRLVSYAEFPPEGAEVELTTWLSPRETLHVCGLGIAGRAKNLTTHRVPLKRDFPASKYTGPGLALEWVEVEGPLADDRFRNSVLANVDLQNGSRVDAERVLRRFLPAAFRRPCSDKELLHYLEIFDDAARESDFVDALKGTLQTVLCSPHFLYLHSQPGLLNSHAIAARLSYFLWNSMPDEELNELASADSLHQPETLRTQVERMLDDPRADAFSESFLGQWLDLRQINATTPDPELYPEFDELLEWSSVQETRLFFDELLENDLSILNLVKSDFVVINDRLALHYDIPDVQGIAFRKVALPAESPRGGLLAQASVLKVTANGTTSSPILRGAWVMDRIVGKTPPPPPAGVPGLEPDIRGATSIREQLDKHRADASCAACHKKIDPPGFALEAFDVIGGWRSQYRTSREGAQQTVSISMPLFLNIRRNPRDPASRAHPTTTVGMGTHVDCSGEFDGKSFRDLDEFRQLLLADEKQIARALLTKLVIYATGTGLQFADRAVLDEMVQRVQSRHYGLRSTIHEVVQSPLFLNQ